MTDVCVQTLLRHVPATQAEADAAAAAAAAAQLQAQLTAQASELAAARVEVQAKSTQVSAVAGQLRELQVMVEQRLAAAAAEGQTALRAERLELQVCVCRASSGGR